MSVVTSKKKWFERGTGGLALAAALLPSAAFAQTSDSVASPAKTRAERAADAKQARKARQAAARQEQAGAPSSTVAGGDIIVVGLRKSVTDSINTKRKARQIVDVVTSEDAGKLPDNNVVEAMARVPGINVTRSAGRADGFTIRGLSGVQTTVNGVEGATAPIPGGDGRSLSLASVPAELVKSIEVYKTRTADQIEGGIAGTVNIELRRPLDLRKGLTVAGGFRNSYAEQGKNWSPQYTLLMADRFDTGIGEMGLLLNGAYTKTRYNEAVSTSESPGLVGFADDARSRLSLPAAIRETAIAPYRAQYGSNDGEREQKSLSAAWQWKASDKLNFVLEGSYFNEKYADDGSSLYVRTREDKYVLSNIRQAPSGALLGYDITNPRQADGTLIDFGNINAGFDGYESRGESSNYRTNFEAHYADDGLRIDGSAQYQWSNNDYHAIGSGGSYAGLNSVRVDFDSPKVLGNGPYFQFNVSPTDPSLAVVQYLRDNRGHGDNQQFSAQVDIWKQLSTDGLLRAAKFGGRYARNTSFFQDGYRFANYYDPANSLPFSSVPGAVATTVTPNLPGGSPLSWIQLNNRQLYDNWGKVLAFIPTSKYDNFGGPGADQGAASLFSTLEPSAANPTYTSGSKENIFAAYSTVDFAFKAGVPVDGNVGLRYVNTWASLDGSSLLLGPPLRDAKGNLTGQFGPDSTQITAVRVNYIDLLPSAFVTAHFTNKLQLRASYNHNVQRPGLFSLRNFRVINYRNPDDAVYSGNPTLKPTTTDDYNLSLEWFPASGAIVSLTGFRKEQTGFIYETAQYGPVPELGGQNRIIVMPRNAGPGLTQGLEFQATGFFRFLPGLLRNLGATANVTWIPTADLYLPAESEKQTDGAPIAYDLVKRRAPYVSDWSYNLIGYYETPTFSARLAYNYRTDYVTDYNARDESYIQSSYPTQRLDAAINVTPVKYLTFSLEAQNLLKNIDRNYYYLYSDLPVGLRAMSRTWVGSVRFRF